MGKRISHSNIPEAVPAETLPTFEYTDFKKGGRIGTGGDADVFRAHVKTDGYTYEIAIKEPRFDGTISQNVVERFQTEAQMWSKLSDHSNIVSVYSWGTEPLPWIGLEYMDGGTLQEKVGNCDTEEALWIAGRIAEGIHHGHRHGVAHLDLKPANILFRETSAGKWLYPKVSDWGLAKLLLDHSTSIEGISPAYAAPEQFDQGAYGNPDDFTDIYQLGAIIYALITGEPPFSGSATQVMNASLSKTPTPPSAVDGTIPAAVDDIVLKALNKDKSNRYDSVVVLRRRVDTLLDELLSRDTPIQSGAIPSSQTRENSTGKNESPHPTGTEQDQENSKSIPVSRRSAVFALGVGAVGAGGGILWTQNKNDSNIPSGGSNTQNPGQDPQSTRVGPEDDTDGSNYPSHSGTHVITADDNYWAWEFTVSTHFVLEYTVTNLLEDSRDFDVLLYPPSEFSEYRSLATGDQDGVRPDYLNGSRPGIRTQAEATVSFSAGTYYLVVDNTDLSDAGDFGTEETRQVDVDASTQRQ